MEIPEGGGASPFLTVDEVARYLRLSAMTVRRAILAGELPAVRAGRQYRVHRDKLAEFIELPSEQAAG